MAAALLTCDSASDCANGSLCQAGNGGCCAATGATGTQYNCPTGCTWSSLDEVCNCASVSGITDTTGTYTGTTCTTEYTSTSTINCYRHYSAGHSKCATGAYACMVK